MNPRTPWLRPDVILFVLFVIGVLWWISDPAPWVDTYIEESHHRIDSANSQLEKVIAVTQSNLAQQSRSRLVAGLVIVLVGLVVALRARWQFLHTARFTRRACPICGGPIVRVHRTQWQRVMEKVFFLPMRRYLCRNKDCRWSGLRFGRSNRAVRHSHRRGLSHE